MLNIIFMLIAGSVFAYIAKDNLAPVSLTVAHYTFTGIPLFFVIIGSLLVGLVIAYFVQIVISITNSFALRSKQKLIKSSQDEILELTKRVHQLELENEKLKIDSPKVTDANAL